MPTGPKGEKRPADVVANAVRVMRIATGEEEEAVECQSALERAPLSAPMFGCPL